MIIDKSRQGVDNKKLEVRTNKGIIDVYVHETGDDVLEIWLRCDNDLKIDVKTKWERFGKEVEVIDDHSFNDPGSRVNIRVHQKPNQ